MVVPSEPPYLPQELVDHIIDHLHDDPLSLINCSIVCRAWLPTSRLHLFAKITLKAPPLITLTHSPYELCKRLYRLLTSSPSIVPYIHELEICEGSPNIVGFSSGHTVRSTTWVTTERTLPPLLKTLTHLKRLEFGAQTILHWGTLPLTLQTAICHVFGLPSLTYVRLNSWSFPNFADLAVLLSCCQNLRGLALSSTRVGGDSEVDLDKLPNSIGRSIEEASDERRCRLEFLTLDYVDFGYLGYWFLSPRSTVEVKSLRELRVAHFHDVTAIERLLVATGRSLEHFHLKPGPWDGEFQIYPKRSALNFILLMLPVHSFDLSHNSGLRSIRLTLEDPSRAIVWVKTLLSSISTSNVLDRIGVEFFTDLKKMEGWAELDSLLVRPELSSLRQVDIGLFAHPSDGEFVKVKKELKVLGSRGILRIYQLGIRSQRSSGQLTPRISHYEYNS